MQSNTRHILTIGVLLSIILIAVPACAQYSQVPYYPLPSLTRLQVWPQGTGVYARVEVDLPDACRYLDHWDTPQRIGSQIIIDSGFWQKTGVACALVITTVSQQFSLGALSPGSYTLVFRAWGQTIKTLAFKVPGSPVTSIRDAKASPDATLVGINSAVVTYVSGSVFYIAADNRSVGLRVEKSEHNQVVGSRADVAGIMATATSGERYIAAGRVVTGGSGTVNPLFLRTSDLGGADYLYSSTTGAGQRGITGSAALNNIGLPVRVWGKITRLSTVSPSYVYIDDGSGLLDGTLTNASPNVGVRVMHSPSGHIIGDIVQVTGISSCFQAGGSTAACVQAANTNDLILLLR